MSSIRRMEDICRGIESAYEEDSLSLRSAKYYAVRIVISQRVFLRKIFRHRKISNTRTARSTSKISFQANQESSWTISIYKPRTSHYKIKISEAILRRVLRKSDTFQNQKVPKKYLKCCSIRVDDWRWVQYMSSRFRRGTLASPTIQHQKTEQEHLSRHQVLIERNDKKNI